MIIRSRRRSSTSYFVGNKANEIKEEKKVEKKKPVYKIAKKKKEEEPILPLVEEALASIEE